MFVFPRASYRANTPTLIGALVELVGSCPLKRVNRFMGRIESCDKIFRCIKLCMDYSRTFRYCHPDSEGSAFLWRPWHTMSMNMNDSMDIVHWTFRFLLIETENLDPKASLIKILYRALRSWCVRLSLFEDLFLKQFSSWKFQVERERSKSSTYRSLGMKHSLWNVFPDFWIKGPPDTIFFFWIAMQTIWSSNFKPLDLLNNWWSLAVIAKTPESCLNL